MQMYLNDLLLNDLFSLWFKLIDKKDILNMRLCLNEIIKRDTDLVKEFTKQTK